jgi:polysaccharide export outer membrane protein
VQIDGTIQLPFLGSIVASNRTVLQLRDDIRRGLMNGGYYADPAVNVTVATFASRYVVVLGEVGAPGLVAVDRAYRVSEIMAKVGGIRSSGSDIISLRRASGEEITLDFNKVSVGGAAEDPVVNPGDKIFVAKAESFYIYGQISQPGTFPLAREMSVQMALARAGGLTPQGSEKKVKLYRNGVQVGRLKLSDIVKGGDVIVVGERFF